MWLAAGSRYYWWYYELLSVRWVTEVRIAERMKSYAEKRVSVQTGCTSTVLNAQRMTEGTICKFPTASVLKLVQCEYFKWEEVTTRIKVREQEKREERLKQKKINEIENIPQFFYCLEFIDHTRFLFSLYKPFHILFIRNTSILCDNFSTEVSTACNPNVYEQ
jgi:hypothetical protein